MRAAGLLLAAFIGAAHAIGPVRSLDLATIGDGPYYTLHLPMALQAESSSPDWTDLRVLNASGEPLSFAWIEAWPADAREHQRAVPVFKLPGAASGARTGPSRGWLLDVRGIEGTLLKVELVFPEATRGLYTLSVEASDDMQHWRVLQPSVQVLSLEHAGQRLDNTTIDLRFARAGYLRLVAQPGSRLPELVSAQVVSLATAVPPRPMQWSEPIAPARCVERECDYALPRHVPLEQLEVQLAEPNTLARVEVLAKVDPAVVPHHRQPHRLRERLEALRHKQPPGRTVPEAASWVFLQTANVYWLRLPEGEVRSAPLWLGSGLHPELRLRTTGPITQLGPKPPALRVGAHTRSLVLLARGPAPYRLVWGGDTKDAQAGGVVPIDQLLPTRRSGDPLPADMATVVSTPAAAAAPPASAAASAVAPSAATPWLWGALLAGLALMAFMAWSLLRGKKAESPTRPS